MTNHGNPTLESALRDLPRGDREGIERAIESLKSTGMKRFRVHPELLEIYAIVEKPAFTRKETCHAIDTAPFYRVVATSVTYKGMERFDDYDYW
jgi:hypothetical protein